MDASKVRTNGGDTKVVAATWKANLATFTERGYSGCLSLTRVGSTEPLFEFELPESWGCLLYILARAQDAHSTGRHARFNGFRTRTQIVATKKRLTKAQISEGSIAQYVSRLRKALRQAWEESGLPGDCPALIETRRKHGYRLAIPVEIDPIELGNDFEA